MDPTVPAGLPAPSLPAHDLSMLGMFLQADIVVKSVMVLLVIASFACWAVIVEKIVAVRRLRREVRALAAASRDGTAQSGPQGEGMAAQTLRAGLREWREGPDQHESRGEFRHRIEHAMRGAVAAGVRRAEPGLPILASTGSVGPFAGLFGTVWGIMNAFFSIAASGDTSLAVVAPGIAEALFVTAIGLAAAIPAVLAYNRFAVGLGRLRVEGYAAAADLAHALSRRPPGVSARAAAAE